MGNDADKTGPTIDIERVRSDTPGVAERAHLNNAGSALPPRQVVDAVVDHLRLEERIGGYEAHDAVPEALDRAYCATAELLGTQPHNLAVVESATRAWNGALSALPLRAGDRVLTTTSEYVSNMGGLLYARDRHGVEIDLVPSDATGQVDVDALASMIDERTRVVSLSHVPTSGGLVNPAAEIGAVVRETDAVYLLDACQSVGQMPMNVDELGCDILSFTGRKFVRGPRGTGMVWVNDATLELMGAPIGMDGSGGDWSSAYEFTPDPTARRFEMFEMSVAAKVGLGVAVDYLLEIGVDAVEARNIELAHRLRSGIDSIDGAATHDLGVQRCAIVTFSVEGHDPVAIKNVLGAAAVNVSVTSATSSQLDFGTRGLDELVRASVHYYNTDDEVDRLLTVISDLS